MSGGLASDTSRPIRWWLLFTAFTNSVICNKDGQFKLTVGLQAPRNISYPFSLLRLGSAMQIAMDKINSNPALSGNFTFDFVYMDTDCNAKTSLRGFIEQVMEQNVSALFGPPCPEEAETLRVKLELPERKPVTKSPYEQQDSASASFTANVTDEKND